MNTDTSVSGCVHSVCMHLVNSVVFSHRIDEGLAKVRISNVVLPVVSVACTIVVMVHDPQRRIE